MYINTAVYINVKLSPITKIKKSKQIIWRKKLALTRTHISNCVKDTFLLLLLLLQCELINVIKSSCIWVCIWFLTNIKFKNSNASHFNKWCSRRWDCNCRRKIIRLVLFSFELCPGSKFLHSFKDSKKSMRMRKAYLLFLVYISFKLNPHEWLKSTTNHFHIIFSWWSWI